MNRRPIVLVLALGLLCCATVACQRVHVAQTDAPRVEIARYQEPDGESKRPSVLLIGDSITLGYFGVVQQELSNEANVFRIPENARSTDKTLERLDAWLGDRAWDVIHINQGLHDLKVMDDGHHKIPLGQYVRNLEVIIARLKATGATIIWATTTPVPEKLNLAQDPLRLPDDVVRYNSAARAVMMRHGIPINELYHAVRPHQQEWQLPENVHYKPEGYQAMGQIVAARIREVLKQ